MSDEEGNRLPDFTSMEGMIANANRVLDAALDPAKAAIPPEIVKACKGVALLSVQQMGFLVSKSSGTGVILAKTKEGGWSPPSAASLSSTGFGAVVGAETKDTLIFFMTDEALEEVSKKSARGTLQLALTVGPIGADLTSVSDRDDILKEDEAMLVYAYSTGLFAGVDMKNPELKTIGSENKRFYGIKASAAEIMLEKGKVKIPPNRGCENLHEKLKKLSEGKKSG